MHYSLHLIFSLSLSKEKKNRKKTTLKKCYSFPSLSIMPRTTFSYKKMSLFSSLSLFFLSFFYFPRPLRQEREGRATTEGQQTREGVPLGSRRLGTFLILFFVLSSQKSLTGFRSINRVMNLIFSSHFGVLCFISFTFIRWGKLLVSHFTIEPKWCLERKTKNEKKKFFEIIHEVRNIKFLLSSPVLLSFFFSFRYLSFLPYFPPDRIQDFLFFC